MRRHEWPALDRELWLAVIQPVDIIDGTGPRWRRRPVTNRKKEAAYGRFLTFLQCRGLPLGVGAVEHIDRATVLTYVDELRAFGNMPLTVLGRVQDLYDVLSAIAPQRDWDWMRNIISWARSSLRSNNNKRHRMVGAEELLDLGLRLMKSAGEMGGPWDAAAYRDGLMIAFLVLRPLRISNLAGLELGKTLIKQRETYRIAFEGEAMKNGEPFEILWPDVLHDALELWLERYRPVLAEARNRWTREVGTAVWVSFHGSPMAKHTIHNRIRTQTLKAFGKPINPHLFRDIAATTWAMVDPKCVGASAPLLAHKSSATTEKYYLQSRQLESMGRYQDRLVCLRNELPRARTTHAPIADSD
jgi:integrase